MSSAGRSEERAKDLVFAKYHIQALQLFYQGTKIQTGFHNKSEIKKSTLVSKISLNSNVNFSN